MKTLGVSSGDSFIVIIGIFYLLVLLLEHNCMNKSINNKFLQLIGHN